VVARKPVDYRVDDLAAIYLGELASVIVELAPDKRSGPMGNVTPEAGERSVGVVAK
jgi:hypothetical protein